MRQTGVIAVMAAAVISVGVCLLVWHGPCGVGRPVGERADGTIDRAPAEAPENEAFLGSCRGRVAVLLLGMDGCPETMKATPLLGAYAKEAPADVVIARVDVPPPDGTLKPVASWAYDYAYRVDSDREIAGRLEFFFYPTLYIVDREGEVRFAGKVDMANVRRMVAEVLAESPGSEKRIYTPPLLAVGSRAPAFTGRLTDGRQVGDAALRGAKGTVLLFGSTTCPFSVAALSRLQAIAETFREQGVLAAVVDKAEAGRDVRAFYAERTLGMPVVLDEEGKIFGAYGVDPVPFCFVLDGNGAVAARFPFTPEGTTDALGRLLGLAGAESGKAASGAG